MSGATDKKTEWEKERLAFERDSSETRASTLRRIASFALAVAKNHISKDSNSFSFVLRSAYEANIINVADLGGLGYSDPTTASRWLNGVTTPNPLTQEGI